MNTQASKPLAPLTVLWCGALILTLSLGARHAFGLFLQPMSMENGWGREVFAFAIALQNLCWGLAQPFVGRAADKLGAGLTMTVGGILYVVGMVLMSQADTPGGLALCGGILIGLGLSGTTFPVVFGAVSRVLPPEKRSMAMGVSMALGSIGQFAFLPMGLGFINAFGWETALILLSAFVALIIPLAYPLMSTPRSKVETDAPELTLGMWGSMGFALKNKAFLMLSLGYFVCGFQLIFITIHLPSFLLDQGIAPRAGSNALALIGLFNILGSYLAGYLGSKYRKPLVLSSIYGLRGVLIFAFILTPISELTVYLFAAGMGVLWLSTVPLTTGTVGAMFGVKSLSMLSGLVFLFHQVGAFIGGWMGGILFDATGSYMIVWWISIALSVIATVVNLPLKEVSAVQKQAAHAAV
ncbi:MAG: MFS transporter [Limnobacter sp.]|nr:MFS transporter [Limnobacter sp.]